MLYSKKIIKKISVNHNQEALKHYIIISPYRCTEQNIYLSCAEYVSTFPFTSSNSTKPGHFNDSDSKSAKPASGLTLLIYLENEKQIV